RSTCRTRSRKYSGNGVFRLRISTLCDRFRRAESVVLSKGIVEQSRAPETPRFRRRAGARIGLPGGPTSDGRGLCSPEARTLELVRTWPPPREWRPMRRAYRRHG